MKSSYTPAQQAYIITREEYVRIGTRLDSILPRWSSGDCFSASFPDDKAIILFISELDANGNAIKPHLSFGSANTMHWKNDIPVAVPRTPIRFTPVRIQDTIQNLLYPSQPSPEVDL